MSVVSGNRIATLLVLFIVCGFATQPSPSRAVTILQDNTPQVGNVVTDGDQILADQKRLADQYKLLEEKLFSLYEFEKDNNPVRSKLLERAYIQSQEQMTANQMKLIVNLMSKAKLKAAENEQQLVLANLNRLLELLQSEDRGKRVRDAIQRNQEYLKEVERILRIQKGLRGQTEGGIDPKRLINSQEKVAKRTKKLADQIRDNEEGHSNSVPKDGRDANSKPSGTDPSQNPDGSEKSNDTKPSDPDDKKSDNVPTKKQESNPGGDPQGGSNPPSNTPPAQSEKPVQPSDGAGESSPTNTPLQNPTRKRIQVAEQHMRDAQNKLEQAQRENAIEDMKQAEREMARAKMELEEILRQLRKEEIERTLAMLEGRFRQMLEREIRVHQSTQNLDKVVTEQRSTEFEIQSGKLSVEQNAIATEAARALLLLREDGSSVAFPATVDEMHQDMLQVASRLSSAKVGRITIEIEEDIIDTLDYLVQALVKTQQDMERMTQKPGKSQDGQPGDRPLVDQLAEIKMLRGLQQRILRRHRRYSRFLDDPEDPVGTTDDPELQAALRRLAVKQAQLTEIAQDIVNEKNK